MDTLIESDTGADSNIIDEIQFQALTSVDNDPKFTEGEATS